MKSELILIVCLLAVKVLGMVSKRPPAVGFGRNQNKWAPQRMAP
jgi:hypothetical protein